VIAILSHGDEASIWARDVKYPIDTVFNYFKGDQCPTLAGKPKIFIIQV
jgi:caspase-like apoptosis-related cysteine protease